LAARLAAGHLGPRLPIALGALLAGISLLCLTSLASDTSYAILWWQMGLMGLGLGLMLGPLNLAMLSATPPAQMGVGASIMNTFRQLGTILGIAVLGSFVLQQFSQNIVARLTQQGFPEATSATMATTLASSGTLASHVPQQQHLALTRTVLNQAFVDALHGAFLIAGLGLLAIAVLVVFLLYQKQDQTHKTAEQSEEIGKVTAGAI
jgi:fucose permease